ncbi:MAG: GNAT family N-acetyltransferase [Hominenteromicrobium sp.]
MEKIVKNYRDDAALRGSFNALAIRTFGIDFEDWYRNGYWTDKYNPYSVVIDGKVVSNVSVNTTDFEIGGQRKRYIQLGTVMTDKAYRNRGFVRQIMAEIFRDCAGKADGIYLFANNDVLSFYPKFGFRTAKQYEYVKTLETPGEALFAPVPMENKADWDKLEDKIKTGCAQSAFELAGNSELNMFYVSKYMRENVFYSAALDAYAIAETDGGTLTLDMVISDKPQDLNRIASGFSGEVREVLLGFTPKDTAGFVCREMDQDDRTLHVWGDMEIIEEKKLMFPLLAHA